MFCWEGANTRRVFFFAIPQQTAEPDLRLDLLSKQKHVSNTPETNQQLITLARTCGFLETIEVQFKSCEECEPSKVCFYPCPHPRVESS